MVSSDIHLAQGEAKDTVMESMAHVKLATNSNKQYEHDEYIKVEKTAIRVLTETYNDLSNGKGMSELLDENPNDVNKDQDDGLDQLQDSTTGSGGQSNQGKQGGEGKGS